MRISDWSSDVCSSDLVILVAHSLGCIAVAWWAALERPPFGSPLAGARLVAPPDVDTVSMDGRLTAFGPAPKYCCLFPPLELQAATIRSLISAALILWPNSGAPIAPMQAKLGISMLNPIWVSGNMASICSIN